MRTRARLLLVLRAGWRVLCLDADEQAEDTEGDGEGERCRWWCCCCWDRGRGRRRPGSGLWWGRLVVDETDSGMLHVPWWVVCLSLAGFGKVGLRCGCKTQLVYFRGLLAAVSREAGVVGGELATSRKGDGACLYGYWM